MSQATKSLEKYLDFCRKKDYLFCSDLQFFIQILDESMLPLFDSVPLLITEGMIQYIRNIPTVDPLFRYNMGNRAWKRLDSLSHIAKIQVIPETQHKTAIDMYCHTKGLNYRNQEHVALAYYLKYKEDTNKLPLFITADKKMYMLAKIIGLKSRLIKE